MKTLDLWKSRDLTFRGKAVVVNQLASSALWYTASVFPILQWAVKQLNEKLWHFFFNSKRPPIPRSQAKLPYQEGGLNVLDASSQKFRVYWEKKFSNLDLKFILNSIFTRDSDRKTCDLQWKIIQLAIPTADRLARHKIIDNPSCHRCNIHNETMLHLLCIAV